MEIIVVVVIALVGFGLFFFVLKRLLRMAVRLALVGAVLFALVVGALAWWWYDPLGGGDDSANRPGRNANARTSRPSR